LPIGGGERRRKGKENGTKGRGRRLAEKFLPREGKEVVRKKKSSVLPGRKLFRPKTEMRNKKVEGSRRKRTEQHQKEITTKHEEKKITEKKSAGQGSVMRYKIK